jgi:hypothetical protein
VHTKAHLQILPLGYLLFDIITTTFLYNTNNHPNVSDSTLHFIKIRKVIDKLQCHNKGAMAAIYLGCMFGIPFLTRKESLKNPSYWVERVVSHKISGFRVHLYRYHGVLECAAM